MSSAQVIVRENFRKTRGNIGDKDHLPWAKIKESDPLNPF
jgi:hypothetical protein